MTTALHAAAPWKHDPKYDGLDHHALNAMLNMYDAEGRIQFDADKRAAREYFLNDINQNTVWFSNLEEKLEYLFDFGHYEREVWEQYSDEFVKSLYKDAYDRRFRFSSFLGAFKFYTSYAMRTNDRKRYLERYEDRVVATALYLGRGDEHQAARIMDEIISGRFQPATPTFLNAGKAQRGELVSCFEAGTPITTIDGPRPIESLVPGDLVLTARGRFKPVTEVGSRLEEDEFVTLDISGFARPLRGTGEHPVLVFTKRDVSSVHNGDGADDGLKWLPLRDVRPGDYVFQGTLGEAGRGADTWEAVQLEDFLCEGTDVALDEATGKVSLATRDVRNNAAKNSDVSVQAHHVNGTIHLTEGAGRLLGYYLAQGYAHYSNGSVKGIRLTFGTTRTRDIEDAAQLIRDVFGVEPVIRDNGDGSTAVAAWSRLVGEFFLSFVGTGFDTKRITQDIIQLSDERFRWGILVGVFRGDGCTVASGIKMSLSNPGLVYDVSDILLSLGGVPLVREYVSASGAPTAEVAVSQGSEVNLELIYAADRDIEKFAPTASPNATLHKRVINGRAAHRVREVSFEKPNTPTRVYNLEVEDDHTYVASRVIVHNCFLVRMEDSMESISRSINAALQLSKRGGGVAFSLTNLREQGAPIKKIENQSSGVVPVMKLFEDSFSYANQLGARQGAGAVYLNAHHPDIFRFLDTKRENADEKVRIKTLSLGVVIPDITFELARNNEPMYLFSPYDVERVYGVPFTDISVTEKYREMVDDDRIKKYRVDAREFFQTVAEIQFESGYPYILFEDTANAANPNKNIGRVSMSNLCVTGDTQVLTAAGYRTVRDLHETQEDFDVVVDERARSMDIGARGMTRVSSTRMFKTAEDAAVYKVTTAEGFELRATEWHKMYVERDGKVVKLPLTEVEVGDRVLVQNAEGAFGDVHEPDLAYLAGRLAAVAGNSTSARLHLDGEKVEFAEAYERAAETVLAERGELAPRFVPSVERERSTLHSAPLAEVLAEHGVTQETKTRVPDFVLRGDRATQRAYLSGLFQLAGSVTGGASIELGSADRQLLVDVQRLLLNFGAYTRIHAAQREALVPDGYGGSSWTLRATTQEDFDILADLIDWHCARVEEIRAARSGERAYRAHRHLATVIGVEFDGIEDVFDVTVEDGHSVVFNGIATGNCSEILQVNTPSAFATDLSYTEVGRDISCNLGSLNVALTMDGKDIAATVDTAMRALTAVSDLSDITAVPSIANGNDRSHSVGLGVMNLHGFLARERIHYDSPEAVEFVHAFFATVNFHSLAASSRLAEETGVVYDGFYGSDYDTGAYFEKYLSRSFKPTSDTVRALLRKFSFKVPSKNDWAALRDEVARTGLYHGWRLAVPPTGSISYINNSTASIHPVAAPIEIRKEGKLGRVYFPSPHLSEENLEFFKDAYEYGPEAILDVYAAAGEHIDQGLSCTLFFKDTATTRDLNRAYVAAWRKGLRTLYYVRIRQMALEGTELEGCVSCAL